MAVFEETVIFQDSITVVGSAVFYGAVSLPAGFLTDAMVASGANIDADKLEHRHHIGYDQAGGSDVVSATRMLYIARGAATIKKITARVTTAPTGGDKQFTVDVQKAANGSSSWSSLLSTVITFSSADSNNTKEDGTLIGSPVLSAGDALRVVITPSGSTGSQGQGMVVSVHLDESSL